MLNAIRQEKWWLGANLVGVGLFLWFASRTWLEPQLRGELVATGGDGVIWTLTALPVLGVFFLADLVWLLLATRRGIQTKDWLSATVVSSVAVIWITAAIFDQLRH